jgi:hypothetical protein
VKTARFHSWTPLDANPIHPDTNRVPRRSGIPGRHDFSRAISEQLCYLVRVRVYTRCRSRPASPKPRVRQPPLRNRGSVP